MPHDDKSAPTWPVQRIDLAPPPLEDLVTAIHTGLAPNFKTANVEIATPPDLRNPPFHLAAPGLSGSPRIADVGGQLYLAPNTNFTKLYDLRAIVPLMEMSQDSGCLIGAGAGPFHILGVNTELMPNISYGHAAANAAALNNQTYYAKIIADDDNGSSDGAGSVVCEKIAPTHPTTEFALMANLFGSNGVSGPLLHIKAKGRTGPDNFTEAIRRGLKGTYGDRLISLAGVFVVHRGSVNVHVMPDFPSEPFTSRDQVASWLRFFDIPSPVVCLSVFHSGDDKGLALRMEHTHCFAAEGGRGGHYHGDLDSTREDVEYEAWFNVAEVLYRIDQPAQS